MRGLCFFCAPLALAIFWSLGAFAQGRTVAITVDDLPYTGGALASQKVSAEASAAEIVNDRLLAAFRARHVPVTGFVIQKHVESLGPLAGTRILKEWISQGFDLGNHTYSHPDINDLSPEEMEVEIARGESGFGQLMREVGKKPEFFRFPMNHTGDTKAKHDVIATFLSQRGYQLATCTIDNSDYLFNDAYVRMLATHDDRAAQNLRLEYLAYTSVEIDYYAGLNKQVFGYEPPQVMLVHDNRLNADLIEQVLALFEKKQYRFVSLAVAQSDAAYQTPDTYITKYGPMWGYRWAKERNVKVNGSLEPDPPKWVVDYGKPSAAPTR
jgi:peptidoglycan/xylan/chitin deacetylase (PgdA/CDA1 family)